MRIPLLLVDFIHGRACRPKCEKFLTRPEAGEISKEDYDKWRYHYPEFDKAQTYVRVPPQDLF